MILHSEEKWIVVSKDGLAIACGVPRSRYLEPINETKKRILTYKSKKMAESGFRDSFFYQRGLDVNYTPDDLEALPVIIDYTIKNVGINNNIDKCPKCGLDLNIAPNKKALYHIREMEDAYDQVIIGIEDVVEND